MMKIRKWISLIAAVLALVMLAGCSAGSKYATESVTNGSYAQDNAYRNDMGMAEMAPEAPQNSAQTDLPAGRKWIVTINLEAETEDLDALLAQLREQINGLGGYVEDQNIYNGSNYANHRYRRANLTIRIPADQADNFTAHVGSVSNVVSSNKNLEDVTLSYVATESRMKALQAEEARLLELMGKAENMSDLLEIEARLTDVRYELESVTSQLRVYDNLVDYATIHLSISEVQEFTPVEEETLWQRIGNGFMDSLKGVGNFFVELMVFLIVSLPYLALIGGIVALIVFLCRRSIRKHRKNHPPRPPYPYNPPQPYPPTPPVKKEDNN